MLRFVNDAYGLNPDKSIKPFVCGKPWQRRYLADEKWIYIAGLIDARHPGEKQPSVVLVGARWSSKEYEPRNIEPLDTTNIPVDLAEQFADVPAVRGVNATQAEELLVAARILRQVHVPRPEPVESAAQLAVA